MLLCLVVWTYSDRVAADQNTDWIHQVGGCIAARISSVQGHPLSIDQQEPFLAAVLLRGFYKDHNFLPIWLDARGLRPAATDLIRAIELSAQEGLHPEDYHLKSIEALVTRITADPSGAAADTNQWANLDLLLSDAFLLLSSHLAGGRINPTTLHPDWLFAEHSVNIIAMLDAVAGEARIDAVLDSLRPLHPGYTDLFSQLQRLRDLDARGGWLQVPDGETLQAGDSDARVLALRYRMAAEGDLPEAEMPEHPELFDTALEEAVRLFQKRHGLEADGRIGKLTLQELNVPLSRRIRQIELNLERWRWLPHDLGENYIVVNTADFSLRVVEKKQSVLSMRVIVGRPKRRTPVFSAPLSHIVINPFWTVPYKIAVEDILPRVMEDAGYLEREGIKVYGGKDESAIPVDPRSIDWGAYDKRDFPFRLVQDPGPMNALGHIKFVLANQFSVYLHDTPNHVHFGKWQRDFSSGCIRVEDAFALACYLLRKDPDIAGRIKAIIAKGDHQVLRVAPSMPVHLLYMTAWVDENGILQFRRDIYKRDVTLDRALLKRTPALSPTLAFSGPFGS